MENMTSTQLAQLLYVAYYGRPADASGLTFWAEQIDAVGVEGVAADFGASAEFEARFGDLTNEELVQNLYQQLFGRDGEQAGVDYWVNLLENGTSLAEIALEIANGAQNADITAINNKVAVAQRFTEAAGDDYAGDDAANIARDFLLTVDADTDAETADVEGALDSVADLTTFTLAEAQAAEALPAKYTIEDSAANLVAAASAAAITTLANAEAIVVAGDATVEQMNALINVSEYSNIESYTLNDTVENLLAGGDIVANAASATVAGEPVLTVAQYNEIAAVATVETYTVVDTAEAILEAGADAAALANAGSVAITDEAVTLEQAVALDALDLGVAYPAVDVSLEAAAAADTLPANYALTADVFAAGEVTVEEAAAAFGAVSAIVEGAANAEELAVTDLFTWSIADTLENIDAADAAVIEGADAYTLTNEAGDLGELTGEQYGLVLGAANADAYTYTVVPSPVTGISAEGPVVEGNEIAFTVEMDYAVNVDRVISYQIEGAETGTAGAADALADLGLVTGTVTIPAGETTGTITLTPLEDGTTEGREAFTVSLLNDDATEVVATSNVVVIEDNANAGRNIALTSEIDTIEPSAGDDTITGSINTTAAPNATNTSTISALDSIDGGAGNDTFKVQVVQAGGATVQNQLDTITLSNVENMVLESAVALTANVSAFTSVTNVDIANITAGATAVTAAATQDVSLSDTAVDAAVGIVGGKDVDVTLTNTTGAANTITLGAGTAVSGTIDVSSTADAIVGGTGNTAMGAITTTGGTTVNITQDANSVSGNAATAATATDVVTTGAVNVDAGNATTTVNVINSDQVNAVAAVAGVAGANQTQTVTFSALNAGQTAVVNGLTFTASKNLTAEEVAQAFANLTNGDRQDDGGPTANGVYSGANNTLAYTSGDANGATVTYSAVNQSSTQTGALTVGGTGTNPTVAAGTAGVTNVNAVTGVAGVTNGNIDIDDNATKSITDITVDGYAGGADLGGNSSLDALQNLTLKNSGAGVATLTTASSGALNLTLDDVDANVNLDGGGASLTSLTVNTEGTASTGSIIAANATSVTINAEANLTAGAATDLSAATNVDINGSAAVNLANNGFDNNTTLQTINAADNTGGLTVTLDTANRADITGGTGNDTVNLAQTTIATGDSIALGAGNDTLNFTGAIDAANIAAGVTLSGGEGDADVIGLTSARATTETADATFEGFIDGFEILSIGQTAANTLDTANLANMDDISHVRYANANTQVQASIAFGAGSTAAVTTNDTISFVSNGVTYTATIGTTAGASATVAEIQTAIDNAVGVAGQVVATDVGGVLTLTALGNDTLVSNGVTAGTHGFVDADGTADNAGTATAITAGTASETISGMANDGTLELQGSGLGATVQMADSTGSADTLNVVLDDSQDANGYNAGTVTTSASAAAIAVNNTSGVETVNITVDDTVQDANNDGIDDVNAVYSMIFAEQTATATTLDIGGAGDLNLTTAAFAANAPLTTVDASDLTGVLTYTANNANMTVTGGSANDAITVSATADGGTFNGGAGNDTFVIAAGADNATLNGGAGADTFDINGVSTTDSNYAVIQGAAAGDTIDLAGLGVNAFNAAAVTLSAGATESTQAFQEAAMNTLAQNAAGWFQYDNGNGVNTFIVADLDGNASYDAGVDATIMLTGAVDLSEASFNTTSGTIEIA